MAGRRFLQALIFSCAVSALNVSPLNNSLLIAPCQAESEKKTEAAEKKAGGKMDQSIYDFSAKALDGHEIKFDQYKGHVLLIVNTASKCGFTPQYEGLESLNKKFAPRGLDILGFPCNQFGAQEPGTGDEIGAFCKKNYGVDFQMFEKIDVNGKDAHPLYKYLTAKAPGILNSEAIKWNFTKFLIDKNGKIVHRYAPNVKPEDITSEIEKLL